MLTPTSQPNKTSYCPYKKKIENLQRNSIKNPSFSKEKLSIPTFQISPSKAKELKIMGFF
jgi:hypothetical protein